MNQYITKSTSYGPLSLHVGEVTHAVDDLINGYEKIVDTLPGVAEKVSQIHSGTKYLAENLEEKMAHMIDGYSYLQSVALEMPTSIQNLASRNRQKLLQAINADSPIDKCFFDDYNKLIETYRNELTDISQQRMTQNINSRNIIGTMKKSNDRLKQLSQPTKHDNNTDMKTHRDKRNDVVADDWRTPLSVPVYKPPDMLYKNKLDEDKIPRKYIARSVGSRIVVPNVLIGNLPEEIENLKTSPVDMTNNIIKKSPKRSRLKRLINTKFQRTDAAVANLKSTIEETTKRLNDDQEKARKDLRQMLLGLQQDIAAHDETVAKVLENVIHETVRRVDHMTEREATDGIETIKEVSQKVLNSRKRDSRSVKYVHRNNLPNDFQGYRTMIPGGKGQITLIPNPNDIRKHKNILQSPPSPNTNMEHGNEVNIESVTKKDSDKCTSPEKIPISAVSSAAVKEVAEKSPKILETNGTYSHCLVGDKDHGLKWEQIPNVKADDFDNFTENNLTEAPLRRVTETINPIISFYNPGADTKDSEGYGGGQAIVIEPFMTKMDNDEYAYYRDGDHVISGDRIESVGRDAQIEGMIFVKKSESSLSNEPQVDSDTIDNRSHLNEPSVISQLKNYKTDDTNSLNYVNPYWHSRVTPLRYVSSTKTDQACETEPMISTSDRNPEPSRLEHDLLGVINSMIHSQQSTSSNTQQMLLTLIETMQQDKLLAMESAAEMAMEQQRVIQEMQKNTNSNLDIESVIQQTIKESEKISSLSQPTASEIAYAIGDVLKQLIGSSVREVLIAQQSVPPPQIILQPNIVLPTIPIIETSSSEKPNVIIKKDEVIQVMESDLEIDNIKNDKEEKMITYIEQAVREGVVHGVRDILDIIIPNENEINIDNHEINPLLTDPSRGWIDKQSITKHVHTIDIMEQMIRNKESKLPSSDETELPNVLLRVDRAKKIETLVEDEIIESQKRLNLLKQQRREESLTDDMPADLHLSSMIYKKTAIDNLNQEKTLSKQIERSMAETNDSISVSTSSSLSSLRLKYSKLKKQPRRQTITKQSEESPKDDSSKSYGDTSSVSDDLFIDMKQPFKEEKKITKSVDRQQREGLKHQYDRKPAFILISNVIPQDSTKALIDVDDESLLGSENDYLEVNPISGMLSPSLVEDEILNTYLLNHRSPSSRMNRSKYSNRMKLGNVKQMMALNNEGSLLEDSGELSSSRSSSLHDYQSSEGFDQYQFKTIHRQSGHKASLKVITSTSSSPSSSLRDETNKNESVGIESWDVLSDGNSDDLLPSENPSPSESYAVPTERVLRSFHHNQSLDSDSSAGMSESLKVIRTGRDSNQRVIVGSTKLLQLPRGQTQSSNNTETNPNRRKLTMQTIEKLDDICNLSDSDSFN